MLDYPLSERRKVLTKLVTPEYARLEVAEYRTGTTAKDIKDRMAWILDKQCVVPWITVNVTEVRKKG